MHKELYQLPRLYFAGLPRPTALNLAFGFLGILASCFKKHILETLNAICWHAVWQSEWMWLQPWRSRTAAFVQCAGTESAGSVHAKGTFVCALWDAWRLRFGDCRPYQPDLCNCALQIWAVSTWMFVCAEQSVWNRLRWCVKPRAFQCELGWGLGAASLHC
jgi:hypothetical protein